MKKKSHSFMTVQNLMVFLLFLVYGNPGAEALSFPWSEKEPLNVEGAWEKTLHRLDKAVRFLDRHENLPEKKLFHKDKEENDEDINQILGDLMVLLGDSESLRMYRRVQVLREYRRECLEEIAKLEEKMLTAPPEGGYFKKSQKDYDEEIVRLKEEIESIDGEVQGCRQKVLEAFEGSGLIVSEEDVRGLFVSVTGRDILGMYGIYQKVQGFSGILEDLLAKDPGSSTAAKKYYGVYALLLRTCALMNRRFVEKIDTHYLPTLEDLEVRALSLRDEAKAQLAQGDLSSGQKKALTSNIKSNTLTLRVLGQYKGFLQNQKRDSLHAERGFQRDYAVALNSYKTIALSRALLEMIRANRDEFHMLESLQLPEMVLFDSEVMWKEFEQISETLQQ